MRTTTLIANTASISKAGLFALLRGLPDIKGSGAPIAGRRLTLVTLVTTMAVMAVGCAPALASEGYAITGSFGEPGSGAGQLEGPEGIAVNDVTGNVYVADPGNVRVDEFDPSKPPGEKFVRAWGWEVNGVPGFDECTALTPTCQKGAAGAGAGQFEDPSWITVDNSKGPSAGDVYVADAGTVSKFTPEGAYLERLTGTCEKPGEAAPCTASKLVPFGELHGVAVDQAGDLWVHAGEIVYELSDTGDFLKSFNAGRERPGLAVDSRGSVYLDGRPGVVKFDPATGQEIEELGEGVKGVAVNPTTNEVAVDEGERVALYGPFGEPATPLQTFPSEGLEESHGIVVNAGGAVYASKLSADSVDLFESVLLPTVSTETASPVAEGAELLHGSVTPEGEEITECKFEWGINAGEYTEALPCQQKPSELGRGTSPVAVSAELPGLTVHNTYHFRLVAASARGGVHGRDEAFYTPTAPTVEEESLAGTGPSDASVSAEIDANGAPTTYEVEYGPATSGAYGSITSPQSLGSPQSSVGVLVRLGGLQPGVKYHYRFAATNALATVAGAEQTFATAAFTGASTLTLPDDRAYEMVSPADNKDVDLPNTAPLEDNEEFGKFVQFSNWPFRASAEGDAIAYQGLPPSVGGNGDEVGNFVGNQFVARRIAAGWQASDITPSPHGTEELFANWHYEAFSPDLSRGIISAEAAANEREQLASGGSACEQLYAWNGGDDTFLALFAPTSFDEPANCETQEYAGSSANDTHNLFQTTSVLTDEAEPSAQENLYDAAGGTLHSVNMLNTGAAPNATFGAPPPIAKDTGANFSNIVSADGSRVFWSTVESAPLASTGSSELKPKALYVRENDIQPQSPLNGEGKCAVTGDACTVQLDTKQYGASGNSGGGRFWGASGDGSEVFFTDCNRLTAGSTAVSNTGCEHVVTGDGGREVVGPVLTGNDLYEYDFNAPEGDRLTDLTVDKLTAEGKGDPLGADVQGVLGSSVDGSYVYFVASGAFAPGATPRTCRSIETQQAEVTRALEEELEEGKITLERYRELINNETGPVLSVLRKEGLEEEEDKTPPRTGCNLYVLHQGEAPKFIATLSPEDDQLPHPVAGDRLGDWSPYLADRTAEVTPDGQSLVFISTRSLTGYDNLHEVQHKTLPAAEVFVYDAATDEGRGALSCASCDPSGAPPSPVVGQEGKEQLLPTSLQSTYTPRWISEDGSRVFFQTPEPLVSQDSDNTWDVYEWEREGSSSCPAATSKYGGCVFLLSGGSGSYPSMLVEASASGGDVFFDTHDRLVPRDGYNNLKLYDAHECTNTSPCLRETSQVCQGAGCQGVPPVPPIFATPSSVTFNGTGNFPSPAPAPAPAKDAVRSLTRVQKLVKALKACKRERVKKKRANCERSARNRYGVAKAKKTDRRAK